MKTHAARLRALQSRGWICEHPDFVHHPMANDKTVNPSVFLEGQIHGTDQAIYLGKNTGLVMVFRGQDYQFDAFLEYIDSEPVRKPAAGQRRLFEE